MSTTYSDRQKRFLQRLQEAHGSRVVDPAVRELVHRRLAEQYNQMTYGDLGDEAVQARVTEAMEEYAAGKAVAPTPYEDPGMYGFLQHLVMRIEDAASAAGVSLPCPPPLVGTLPTGSVNARTVLVPGTSEYLVLFEDQFFHFALLASKAIASAFPLVETTHPTINPDPVLIRQRLEQEPEVGARFAEVVLAYAHSGQPGRARPYLPARPYGLLAGSLQKSLEMFALGHEYGHVVRGHLEEASHKVLRVLPDEDTEALQYSWRQEYEADIVGTGLCIGAMLADGNYLPMSFWGIDCFFSVLDVVKRASSILSYGAEQTGRPGSHPPPNERRRRVRGVLRSMVDGPSATEQLEVAHTLGATVASTVELLWEQARPLVLDAHRQGLRPVFA